MEIEQIYYRDYSENITVKFSYTSQYYYSINIITKKDDGWSFNLHKEEFDQPYLKEDSYNLFDSNKDFMEYYTVKSTSGEKIGVFALQKFTWNRFLRLWEIHLNNNYRRMGFGSKILEFAEQKARELKVRGVTLECQNTNYPAIQFYLKNGYDLTSFDIVAYSDPKLNEFRLDMTKIFEPVSHKSFLRK